MKSITAILSIASLSLSAKAQKYIVANSYNQAGCDGAVSGVSNINTGQCYYAKEECSKPNTNLAPECEYLNSLSFGDDISFVATCTGGKISAIGYKGKGCTDKSNAINNGTTINIPVDQCLLNFKLYCSDNPQFKNLNSGSKSIPGMVLGMIAMIFV